VKSTKTIITLIATLLIHTPTTHSEPFIDTVTSFLSNNSGPLTIGALGLASAALFCKKWVHPYFEFPPLTGPYKVGTTSHHLIDTSRMDPYPQSKGDYREVMIHCWYPCETDIEQPLYPYLPEKTPYLIEMMAQAYTIPAALLSPFFPAMYKHAIPNAPIAQHHAPYPVIMFAEGFFSMCDLNAAQIENLASHGYIVVGVDVTHLCLVSIFPDGRIKKYARDFLPTLQDEYELALDISVKDIKFGIDNLGTLAQDDPDIPICNAMDLNRIGMFGYCSGGINLLNLCPQEPRIKAAVNLDGWEDLLAEKLSTTQTIPIMHITKDSTLKLSRSDEDTQALLGLYNAMEKDAYHITIKGTRHNDFYDLPFIKENFLLFKIRSKIKGWTMIDPYKVNSLMRDYVVTFFDKYLKGIDAPWPAPCPEYSEFVMINK